MKKVRYEISYRYNLSDYPDLFPEQLSIMEKHAQDHIKKELYEGKYQGELLFKDEACDVRGWWYFKRVYKRNKPKEHIGTVYVDSGQLMIGDPCYLGQWKDDGFSVDDQRESFDYTYSGACRASLSEEGYGILIHPQNNRPGASICVRTAFGDGGYDAFLERDRDGNPKRLIVNL